MREKMLTLEVAGAAAGIDRTIVTFEEEQSGQTKSLRLVAADDANPEREMLSVDSPIGAALNGEAVGQVVEVKPSMACAAAHDHGQLTGSDWQATGRVAKPVPASAGE